MQKHYRSSDRAEEYVVPPVAGGDAHAPIRQGKLPSSFGLVRRSQTRQARVFPQNSKGQKVFVHAYDKSIQRAYQLFQSKRKPSCDLQNVGVKSLSSATRVFGVTCEQLQKLDRKILP